jgi:hypothetical protein
MRAGSMLLMVFALGVGGVVSAAQTQRAPARRPATPATTTAPADLTCPAPLGVGVTTKREFCDVLSSLRPEEGVIVTLPPHRGELTLSFDLHNRHTYSEQQMKANRSYARYTAIIGVLDMEGTLVSRGVVRSEFRTAADLLDRIGGGAGPGGVKAVAPTGIERVVVKLPQSAERVSILGEVLQVDRPDGTAKFNSPGRPIAVISNVTVEYRPAPAATAKPTAPTRRPGQ